MSSPSRQPMFIEVHEMVDTRRSGAPLTNDVVIVSNIRQGMNASRPERGLTLRYVGRGEESYTIAGRSYRLTEGQLMLARQEDGAHVHIRSTDPRGTLGLCVFLATDNEREFGELPGPIVIGDRCSSVGEVMKSKLKGLVGSASPRPPQATELVRSLAGHLPALLSDLASEAESIQAVKPSTRLDAIRKVEAGRAYLHSVTQRSVGLDELAAAVGSSRFHFLRMFQQCLGETPAQYHRRLRLTLAIQEARQRELPLDLVADKFGFASASSLSHAHRRTFGRSPFWSKRHLAEALA